MAYRPQRLILINAGRYDYANVELSGSLQIVGPNNTGKTTLINTLQFLYLDDRRHMDFGSYTPEQTRDYYFPSEYSYILFELLGAGGKCVLGWRGQSRIIGGDPERFLFNGPFEQDDFLDAESRVREPKDVNARLSLKQFAAIRNAQEHREFLLLATRGDLKGIGLVALRENERYPQFRETLKNLLSLTTISQDQMRTQLLMLAGLPTDGHALNVRELFGSDYDHILRRKQKLLSFKRCQRQIELLVDTCREREKLRSELMYRWSDLQTKRLLFEQKHANRLQNLRTDLQTATNRIQVLSADIANHYATKQTLAEKKGSLANELKRIHTQAIEFAGFLEDWTRNALQNVEEEMRQLQRKLEDAQEESREKVQNRVQRCRDLVTQRRRAAAHFDRALVTILRNSLQEEQLASLARLFNFELLEQPVGDDGVVLRDSNRLVQTLRLLSERIRDGVYRDPGVDAPLPTSPRDLSEIENIHKVRQRLAEDEEALRKCEATLEAIDRRDSLLSEFNSKREQIYGKKDDRGGQVIEGMTQRLFRFEQYQQVKDREPQLAAELKRTERDLDQEDRLIQGLETESKAAREQELSATRDLDSEEKDFRSHIGKFSECSAPTFLADSSPPDTDIPDDFLVSIDQYRDRQKTLSEHDKALTEGLLRVENALGPDYTGNDELETTRLLREELEALPEREDVLRREWDHQLTNLQATFDNILTSLSDINSAVDRLNRELSHIRVSNLATLHMQVLEQADTVSSMRRLVKIEQPGLFEESTGLEARIASFRQKFESNPILRYPDLFTLRFTVTGDDGKPHHYHDFRQVESHGTTITIKVLFNLLVLRSLIREDVQKNFLCEIPFFLDEIHSLDPVNRSAILTTARKLGFIAITAAPESVSEVDVLYFLQPQKGRIVLQTPHRVRIMVKQQRA